jgi:hypothetical protein
MPEKGASMRRMTVGIAALLFASQAHAEDVILNCHGDVKMWWERDEGGEM